MGFRAKALRARAGKGVSPVAVVDQLTVAVPATPYRGIHPFRYVDHPIFFAREDEAIRLANLVAVYRGTMLYGDSGTGKSSLVNAGLIPKLTELGFHPERLRVQPRSGEELVVQRIAATDDDSEFLPSLFAPGAGATRTTLSTEAFGRRLRAASAEQRVLIVFDQFEEIVTLFQGTEARQSQAKLAELIAALLHEPLAIKLLFAFREDYLGRVKQLLAPVPELVDQALRLTPPSADALLRIIRGPFERYPDHFARELSPELAKTLSAVLAERFGAGDVSLSEVQTVCLRLWQSDEPQVLLADKGVQGLLEDYLGEALYAFPPDLRGAAIALLSQMVTSAGTRNVVSAEDLIHRVREDEKAPIPLLERALARLESESKLVRRERRRDLYLYEVTSEFLLPWISRRREEFRRAQERRKYRRRVRVLTSIAGVLLVVAVGVVILAAWALEQRDEAKRQADAAAALGLASSAQSQLESRPDISLLLALAALEIEPSAEARSSMISALATARRSGAIGVLHGHPSALTAVTFSRDGETLITSDDAPTVRRWDVGEKEQLGRPLTKHVEASFSTVAYSRDGRTIASVNDDKIQLWDARTLKQRGRPLTGQSPSAIEFSQDGRKLASAGYEKDSIDDSIRLWDVRTHRLRRQPIMIPTEFAEQLEFDGRGRTIAVADDETIRVFDLRTARQVGSDLRHDEFLSDLALSPGGRMAAASHEGTLRLWDVRAGTELASPLAGRLDSVTGLAFSPDGRTLAFGGERNIRLWDVRAQAEIARPLAGHTEPVADVAFSPDGQTLASAGNDDTVRLWDVRAHTRMRRTGAVPPRLGSEVEFSADGQTLAEIGDETVQLWDVRAKRPLGPPLTNHHDFIIDVAFSPDGQTLATAAFDDTIRLWDVRTQTQDGRPLTGSSATAVAFSPDGQRLASAGYELDSLKDTIRLWDVRTHRLDGEPFPSRSDYVSDLEFDAKGETLASAGDDKVIRLWDVGTRTARSAPLEGHTEEVYDVVFSPDGRTLASTGGQSIRLWDFRSGQLLRPSLTGHTEAIGDLTFSSGGRVLASAGDRTVRLWDVQTRRQLASFEGHARVAAGVVFNPARQGLTSAGGDGFRVWDRILLRDFAQLRDEVCRIVGTGLSRTEWAQYAPRIPYKGNPCP